MRIIQDQGFRGSGDPSGDAPVEKIELARGEEVIAKRGEETPGAVDIPITPLLDTGGRR